MTASAITYRELKKYKYQLTKPYAVRTAIIPAEKIETPYLTLGADGILIIAKWYAWDGPSALTIDTDSFMRGSLVHDAFYQFIRDGHLDLRHKPAADDLLRDICLQDGMLWFRAWYVWKAVSWFGQWAIHPPWRLWS